MRERVFFDTNILIYAFDEEDACGSIAEALVFVAVARRKRNLYSADLRNGQVIEGLRIENPFPSVN